MTHLTHMTSFMSHKNDFIIKTDRDDWVSSIKQSLGRDPMYDYIADRRRRATFKHSNQRLVNWFQCTSGTEITSGLFLYAFMKLLSNKRPFTPSRDLVWPQADPNFFQLDHCLLHNSFRAKTKFRNYIIYNCIYYNIHIQCTLYIYPLFLLKRIKIAPGHFQISEIFKILT